jgi:hypothetical protein
VWTGKVEQLILSSEEVKEMKGMAKNQKSYTRGGQRQKILSTYTPLKKIYFSCHTAAFPLSNEI